MRIEPGKFRIRPVCRHAGVDILQFSFNQVLEGVQAGERVYLARPDKTGGGG